MKKSFKKPSSSLNDPHTFAIVAEERKYTLKPNANCKTQQDVTL